MSLRRDDRAVTVQVGAILFFAIVIILLAMYQAQVVPEQNADAEFDHSQAVQDQLVTLRNGIVGTALTGQAEPVAVDLGTRFPSRIFFINPPPGAGRLETAGEAATVSVSGAAAADPEVREYWDDGTHAFDTKRLTYTPNYQVYGSAPTTVYGATVLYNRFSGANLTLTGQRLVQGNTITLVTLNGSLSESGLRTATVSPRALSATANTVTVRNETGEITLTLDSRLPVSKWRELLAGQSQVRRVESAPDGGVRVVLTPGTYELRLARIGVGTGAVDPPAHYAVPVDDTSLETNSEGRAKLAVEVRDRFNNPVSNATVTFSGGTGDFETSTGRNLDGTVTTGASGRAVVWYNASGQPGVNRVNATLGDDATGLARERVRFEIVNAAGGPADFVVPSDTAAAGGNTVTYVLNVTGSAINMTGIRLSYFNQYTASGLTDGPDAVTEITVGGETRTVTAEEGRSPSTFDTPITLQPGENTLTLSLDETYAVSATNEAVGLDVTLSFEGGLRESYPAYIFGSAPTGNTAPTVNAFSASAGRNDKLSYSFNVSDAEGWAANASVNVTVVRTSDGTQVYTREFTPDTNPYTGSDTNIGLSNKETYRVTVTVRDGDGGVTTAERTVTT